MSVNKVGSIADPGTGTRGFRWWAMSDDSTNPGDEAEPGTPGTGENICRHCNGTGEHDGVPCPVCGGTGKVTEGLAGG